ncbi:MAG: ABC transporter substrate-binding protein, partial [Alphaproteobacteria bacterium]|nr:ABC transporter substrate-binding protein [Alphaproteobacteria bacterium]
MNRREFITLLGGAVAPLTARGQQPKRIARIGLFVPPPRNAEIDAFLGGLRDLGWIEGTNVHVEYRDAGGDDSR